MISFRLAWRSVVRRPVQNLAVIIGITLGVSLFVGIQVGSQSLGTSFGALAQRSLGKTEAQVSPLLNEFILTPNALNEELSPYTNGTMILPPNNKSLIEFLKSDTDLMKDVEGITERIEKEMTVIYDELGSIEISMLIKGIPEKEENFGKFVDIKGKELKISDLEPGEVYIGRDAVESLFGEVDPIGKNLSVSTSFFTLEMNFGNFSILPQLVSLNTSVRIVGIFEDRGRGTESSNEFIATSYSWLEEQYQTALLKAKTSQTPEEIFTKGPILGFGSHLVNVVKVNWVESIDTSEERDKAFERFGEKVKEYFGNPLSQLNIYSNRLNEIQGSIEEGVNNISLLLNVFGSLIAFSAVLVIINIQSMALQAREKETGIERAIGANRRQIILSNLYESLFLGIIGSILGIGGGFLYGKALILFLSWSFGFDSNLITLVFTPSIVQTSFYWGVIISLVTGIIPAVNASRINVAQVLRGITPPSVEKIGRKQLYFGFILTIIAFIFTFNLDPNPLIEGKDAFYRVEDAETIYLPVALIFLGPSFLFAYFRSKRVGMTVASLGLMVWAYINIFVVFKWIETGNSTGLLYIAYIMFSLIGGSIIFISANLDTIASAGERMISWIVRKRKTPIRGTTMVAFRQMRNKKVRSTLTFALFATILTLNIFIGSWSYSTRYGLDKVITEVAGNTDVSIMSNQPMPANISFDQKLLDEFGSSSRDIRLEYIRPFTVSRKTSIYVNKTGELEEFPDVVLVTGQKNALWKDEQQKEWLMKFDLEDNKTGTPFEFMKEDPKGPIANREDEEVWKALFNNETVNGLPIIVAEHIATFSFSGVNVLASQGDTVFLNLTDGTVQEFFLASIITSNPLVSLSREFSGPQHGPPSGGTAFVSSYWAEKLVAFAGKADTQQIFIGKTNAKDINDERIKSLLLDIEFWANAKEGGFRKSTGKIFGIYGVRIYSIYERFLEGQYRFFNFLQAYVSMGFLVGILGLLVVASRSVAERKRQIGMLRALGFRRSDVVSSVVLELVVMGLIGLVLGLINGTVMGYALTTINNENAEFLLPWLLILGYGVLTFVSAIIAAIIPGIKAAQIPPSDALRYTG